jgi:putative FmdB family regulatory protein
MPTYEYQCKICKHKFEAFQKITDRPLKACPKCKGKIKRLISSGAGFIFKGSGFYTTDYRSPEYKKKSQEEKKQGPSCPASGDNPDCKQCPQNRDE